MRVINCLILALCCSAVLYAQKPVAVDVQDDYEASMQYPFGRLNPNAPPETKQFAFIVGSFSCKDRLLNPASGKWFEMNTIRRAEYALNGNAIQDKNYTNVTVTTNLRIYDPVNKEWVVSFFKAPFGRSLAR